MALMLTQLIFPLTRDKRGTLLKSFNSIEGVKPGRAVAQMEIPLGSSP
jgi:hypothetical protein